MVDKLRWTRKSVQVDWKDGGAGSKSLVEQGCSSSSLATPSLLASGRLVSEFRFVKETQETEQRQISLIHMKGFET